MASMVADGGPPRIPGCRACDQPPRPDAKWNTEMAPGILLDNSSVSTKEDGNEALSPLVPVVFIRSRSSPRFRPRPGAGGLGHLHLRQHDHRNVRERHPDRWRRR